MRTRLRLHILRQPDDFTCGPTCLHAVYGYYGREIALQRIIDEAPHLDEGGTLAVYLACDALRRGYRATIYTYNLQVFDPTWFLNPHTDFRAKLQAQMQEKKVEKLHLATRGYLEFLERGGQVRFAELTRGLIRRYLKAGIPILTGLSATYLYGCAREFGPNSDYDDIRGVPTGHFVVLCGYDKRQREVLVADPHSPNPRSPNHKYVVGIDRVINSILIGILTYDANLLIIEPPLSS